MERPNFKRPAPVKVAIPVGALLDIPTGDWIKGTHGQYVLNAGIGNITGVIGPGNSFKTTILRDMVLSAINRMIETVPDVFYGSYDTEINTHEQRNKRLSFSFDQLYDRAVKLAETTDVGGDIYRASLIDEGIWQMTDKSVYPGNKYFDELKTYLKDKREDKKAFKYETAYLDRDGVTPLKVMAPSVTDFDSLTHFITSDVEKIMDDTELGESAGNTMYMRQGLAKSRMLLELPTLAAASGHYFLFTAHIGTNIQMPSAPGTPPPRKQLQHMNQGEIIKGVTNNFFYLLHNCWLVTSARPFLNQGTKAPEYPYEPGMETPGDLDLNIVTLKQLRGKNGCSGFSIELLVSQEEGVLPGLSEFHYIKRMNRFGLEGSDRDYALLLCPEIRLSRTKVRKAIRESKRLQRALEITSQLCQMHEFHRYLADKLVTIEELKKALDEKGYDWDLILEQTRGWNTLDDERHSGYPLSTYDLCRIAKGTYHPYWLEDDCKTIKPKYKKLKEIVP